MSMTVQATNAVTQNKVTTFEEKLPNYVEKVDAEVLKRLRNGEIEFFTTKGDSPLTFKAVYEKNGKFINIVFAHIENNGEWFVFMRNGNPQALHSQKQIEDYLKLHKNFYLERTVNFLPNHSIFK